MASRHLDGSWPDISLLDFLASVEVGLEKCRRRHRMPCKIKLKVAVYVKVAVEENVCVELVVGVDVSLIQIKKK